MTTQRSEHPSRTEREARRRWIWGGIGVVVVIALVSSVTLTFQDPPRSSPGLPELPETVAMDRPLLGLDLAVDRDAAMALLAAEDARGVRAEDAERIRTTAGHQAPELRRAAVRAMGRLEDPAWLEWIVPALADEDPRVRGEAAGAVAQAVHGEPSPDGARALGDALDSEADPRVQGALARALGRLRLESEDPVAVAQARAERLLALTTLRPDEPGGVMHDDRLLGVARGAFFLARGAAASGWPGAQVAGGPEPGGAATQAEADPAPLDRLAGVMAELALDPGAAIPVRRAAAQARVAAGRPPTPWIRALMAEAPAGDAELRRIAAAAARDPDVVTLAMADPAAAVRVEGVRGWIRLGPSIGPSNGCGPLAEAVSDPADVVSLAALAGLGDLACGAEAEAQAVLEAQASRITAANAPWHRPLHALLAWARHDPAAALPTMQEAAGHPSPFVRAHVARGASRMVGLEPGAVALLRELAEDPSANVREAALPGLSAALGREADALVLRQLADPDPQLVRTASRLLAGSPATPERTDALLAALERFTAGERATDRDARLAILERLGEVWEASEAQVARLRPWLRDPDPRVAFAAAVAIERWTGLPNPPDPAGALPGLPFPSWGTLRALEDEVVVLELEDAGTVAGGEVRIQLFPFEAPTNAARLAELAGSGALDGLTLHRVAPNFVIQGGSPGGNEYAGHGAYTRDEVGRLSHWAGTVGLSTRGRDTGDGQFFVNLVDNLRLDHDYTVFGVVVQGMELLEAAQEGVRIRSARRESR